MARKFIIENAVLILGNVALHADLANNEEDVEGGGYWEADTDNNKLYLYSSSHDFGPVSPVQLQLALSSDELDSSLSSYSGYEVLFSPETHDPITNQLQDSGKQTAVSITTL